MFNSRYHRQKLVFALRQKCVSVCCRCCSFSTAVTKAWITHLQMVCSGICEQWASTSQHFLVQTQFSAKKTLTKCLEWFLTLHKICMVNQDSVVCAATCCRLDSPGTESQRGRQDFLHHPGLALEPNQPPVWGASGLFPGGTVAEAWRWPPTPSSAEVKEGVELHFYSLSLPWWSVLRQTFTFL